MIKIRYYSHVGIPTGYGRAAGELALALAAHPEVELELVQLPVKTHAWQGLSDPRMAHLVPRLREGNISPRLSPISLTTKRPDVVLIHTLAVDCASVLAREDIDITASKLIAYTTYDGTIPPADARQGLELFTQVWIPSFDHATWATWINRPIKVIPHAFDAAQLRPPPRHRAFGDRPFHGAGRFRFYFIGHWSPRKNIEGLIRAYAAAFHVTDDVELVIRSKVDAPTYVEALASTGLDQEDIPPVTLLDQELSDDEIWALHADADCYVTATRGECWDLPAFEAAITGRMVISPKTGSYEFLKRTDALILPAGRVEPAYWTARADPAPGGFAVKADGQIGMTCRDRWRDPDLHELAMTMREAYKNRVRALSWCDPKLPGSLYGHQPVADRAVAAIKEIL